MSDRPPRPEGPGHNVRLRPEHYEVIRTISFERRIPQGWILGELIEREFGDRLTEAKDRRVAVGA